MAGLQHSYRKSESGKDGTPNIQERNRNEGQTSTTVMSAPVPLAILEHEQLPTPVCPRISASYQQA